MTAVMLNTALDSGLFSRNDLALAADVESGATVPSEDVEVAEDTTEAGVLRSVVGFKLVADGGTPLVIEDERVVSRRLVVD